MRSLCAAFIIWIQLHAAVAYGGDFGLGIAAVDDMSDNAEPAAMVRLGWSKNIYSRYYYWGRSFGPVSESHHFVTLVGTQEAPGLSFVSVNYGGVFLAQETTLYASTDLASPERERSYNLGAVLGISVPYNFGPVRCEINWDSHIFMVGSSAIIFLASARKPALGLTVGVSF